MAKDEAPPFERGKTFYNGDTIDSNNLGGLQYEGKEYIFEDIDYSSTGAKTLRSPRKVRCRIVRNIGAAALLPKRLVSFAAATYGKRVDGYSRTTAAEGYPVDEFLPSAGVAVNDLFFIVVEGPATVLTDLAGGSTNVINAGDVLVALTAATSGATTAGRAIVQDLTGATALLANQVQNRIGVALSSKTTANTNADCYVEVKKW